MKVFVTGHRGFVGKNLTPHLEDWKGYDGDILDKQRLIEAMKGCNAVIHLAGKFNGPYSHEIYETNVIGTANVAQAMYENNISKIIYTSSVGAGDRFCNAYDDSKFIAEKILLDKQFDTTILRLSNLYGKGQDDKFIANMISGFRKGIINISGDGTQTRDFVHVSDVICAIKKALRVKGHTKPIDIGFGKSRSIIEVVHIISELTEFYPEIKFTEHSSWAKNIPKSKVNLTLARKILNYKPKVTLEKGLEELI